MRFATLGFAATAATWLHPIATALLLGGCATGPDYRSPDVPAPSTWRAAMTGGLQIVPSEAG